MQAEIRSAILDGDIDRALSVTHEKFPEVLSNNEQIVFRLKCRKWVELISKAADLKAQSEHGQKSSAEGNGHNKDSAVADDFAQDMELDDHPIKASSSDKVEPGHNQQYDLLISEAMQYGMILQREYGDPEHESEQSKTLTDIFSLVAYINPRDSVHGGLLDRKGRVSVAEELNSAILGKYLEAYLDCLTFSC
jgi:Ran-binding protein 9/10